jgi:hypothetical protein
MIGVSMTIDGNKIKHEKLGMPFGTANGRLKKLLIYDLANKLELLNCFRCGKKILSVNDFSIDHKKSWLYSNNPVKYFFDVTNIAFSHISCNTAAGRTNLQPFEHGHTPSNKITVQSSYAWCYSCKTQKSVDDFSKNASKYNGVQSECKQCRSTKRKEITTF